MGKIRLALQVAVEVSDGYTDGVFVVLLAPLTDPEQVILTIAQILSISDVSFNQEQRDLKGKQLLLVLDNFEQVASAALLVAELLATCPRLKIVATSRVALHVPAERDFSVPPLSLPDLKHLPDLVTFSQYEAVTLFIERAQAVKSDFQVSTATAPAVAGICTRLNGLPLAIELAAARAKYYSPPMLFARLEQGFSVLSGGARDLPARQQTLRGAIAWGDLAAARHSSQEGLMILHELRSQALVPTCLEVVGTLMAAQEMVLEAVKLWGTAEAVRKVLGTPMHSVERAEYEKRVTAARMKVGEETFAKAWTKGRTTPVEEVITTVLRRGRLEDEY